MGFESELIGCFIPECSNTSADDYAKRFAIVPKSPNLRQLWIQAGLRLKVKLPIVDSSPLYCCEDHFDLKEDGVKQLLEESEHSSLFITIKSGIFPHKFPSNDRTLSKKPFKNRLFVNDLSYGSSDSSDPSNENGIIGKESCCVASVDSSLNNESQRTLNAHIREGSTFQTKSVNKISIKSINIDDANDEYEIQIIENNKIISTETDEKLIELNVDVIGSEKPCGNNRHKNVNCNGDAVELLSKQFTCEAMDGPSLKRKVIEGNEMQSNAVSIDSGSNIRTNPVNGSTKKKRKIVQEILAWIPSNPSIVSEMRSWKGVQPVVVVEPVTSTSHQAPLTQLQSQPNSVPSVASIPLKTDKVTQFMISVPENSSTNCLTSQVMLAVPQGCSYSIDKLTLFKEKCKTKENSDKHNNISPCSSETGQVQKHQLMDPYSASSESIKHLSKSNACNNDSNEAVACSETVNSKSLQTNSLICDTHKSSQPVFPKPSLVLPINPTRISSRAKSGDNQGDLCASLQLIETEFTSMIRLVDSLRKELSHLKSLNLRLRDEIKTKDHQISIMTLDKTKRLELVAVELKRVFTANQIRMLLEESKERCRVTWTDQELAEAYSFYRISPEAYKVLHNNLKYPFPSITTVKRYIEKKELQSKSRCSMVGASQITGITEAAYDDYDSDEEVYRDEKALRQSIAQQMFNDLTTSRNGFHEDGENQHQLSFLQNSGNHFNKKTKEKIIIVCKPAIPSTTATPLTVPTKTVKIQKPSATLNGSLESRIREQHNCVLDKNVSKVISVDSENDMILKNVSGMTGGQSKTECSTLVSNVEAFQIESDFSAGNQRTHQQFLLSNNIMCDEQVCGAEEADVPNDIENVVQLHVNSPLSDENIMCQEIVIHCDSPVMLPDEDLSLTFN